MKKIIIIIFLWSLSTFSFAQNESVKMDVMMKMLSLKNALVAKDSITLSKVLANDVTYGHTNAMVQTKAELIRDVVSKVQDYTVIDPSEMNIRIFENTAIVNMKSKVVMNYKNEPLEIKMKVVLTWIKKGNDWVLEARQAVKE